MTTVLRAGALILAGQHPTKVARLVSSGELVRVRHGAYCDELAADVFAKHRQLIAGTWPLVGEGTVISHLSAGVLHGLPTWADLLDQVTVTRLSAGHGSSRPSLRVRCGQLRPDEIVIVDGYRTTSLARTASDLARLLPFERAVAVLDAALHAQANRELIGATIGAAVGRRGVTTARAAFLVSDGRAESVGESISRLRITDVGLPLPELQVNIFDAAGLWLARSDFGWLARGVLGEFDGRLKYVGTPEQVSRAVMKEKAREAALRKLGWGVVRWEWADLAKPTAFRERIEAAFEQANPARIRGHFELT